VIRQHFLDSLSCGLSALLRPHIRVLDIGAGAGFPSIPLKIYFPDIQVTAVDAVAKKIGFVRHLCRVLQLQNVDCVTARLEQAASPSYSETSHAKATPHSVPAQSFDLIVSRAVGTIPYLLELAAPWLAPQGHILLQRGHHGRHELAEQTIVLQNQRFQLVQRIEISFSFCTYPRYLLIFCKAFDRIHENKA
jgi:16S rRNA (guanine527-N7)-methyltransferase